MIHGTDDRALPAAKWVTFLERAGVFGDAHAKAGGTQAKAIAAGKYLGAKVGRTVPVGLNGRTGKATLRVAEGRAREKKYWFEIAWDLREPRAQADATATVPEPHSPDAPAWKSGADPIPTPAPIGAPKEDAIVVKDGNGEEWE
ncbi:hypothetical protein J8F10_16410 [Gemmata sp. G18]|uniref:Uncharacterized protein n=1 Tax=Gemmata palustris TaxID=2822762 RepID=A0ABS5BT21_9BACT|nr:hypothetical protein [Gemmata palustris]MBP3956856.1 hypothetical protein [Gemmata palustris]